MASKPAALIIVAAGRGARFGGLPKQYQPLAGKPVLAHLLARASGIAAIGPIIVVIHPDDGAFYAEAVLTSGIDQRRVFRAPGGASRQASVRNGLESLAAANFPASSMVLIHDAARPFLNEVVVLRGLLAASASGAAIPTLPVVDTVAELDADGNLKGNPDRNRLGLVQTPQVFRFGMILDAHRSAATSRRDDFTDDASVAAAIGTTIATFSGEASLFKITHMADLARAEAHLAEGQPLALRTGLGFDVHAFTAGNHVMIGGVKIPHDRALLGHSDADPLLHAMTDALLGAIGDGDIGQHFPPGDPRWKGAASILFLVDARRRVEAHGGRILNLDGTVICEAPRIGPHREAIISLIAEALELPSDAIGIKATTSEKLGFTGRREGIAAMAVATVAFAPKIWP